MCYGCYQQYGQPRIVNERTIEAATMIASLYERAPVGGNLHIVTDDWNIEDDDVQWCADRLARILSGAIEQYDDTDPVQLTIEQAIIDLIMPMSVAERASALAIWDGFLEAA